MNDKPIWMSKTFWTGIAGICAGIGAYFGGDMTILELIQVEVIPFGLIFMRLAIGNKK